MMLKTRLAYRLLHAGAVVVVALSLTNVCPADGTPWQGNGSGSTAPDPDNPGTDCDLFMGWGGGQVGNYVAEGCHVLDDTGMFEGEATWTNINGDTLNVTYTGQVFFPSDNPEFPFGFTGTMYAVGGTGSLENAVGVASWSGGFTGVPGDFFFNFDGILETDGNFNTAGIVRFTNIVGALEFMGETSPYIAPGWSPQLGVFVQTGSILPNGPPMIDLENSTPETTVLRFPGVQGRNPYFFNQPVHVYLTRRGLIFCKWDALFTIELNNATGESVFSGDGYFTVLGGSGLYRHATGSFQTLFQTGTVPMGADSALAHFNQNGTVE